MNLLSAFGGGLWIIPVGFLLAALYSAYRGYRSSKSNSTTQTPGGTIDNTGNVSYLKTGGGLFSLIFLAAALVSFLLINSDR